MLPRLSLLTRLFLLALAVPALVAAPVYTPVAFADDDDDDDDDEGGDEDEDEEEDASQPPVTAGGMFTKKTYPVAEIERTLQLIGGMAEVRAGFDIDVSANTAFETWLLRLDGGYGLQDNLELQAGLSLMLAGDRGPGTPLGAFYAGVEAGVVYDVVNFRALTALTFTAGAIDPADIDVGFDIILGMPFRYRVKPTFAIFALDKILTIHTDGEKPDLTVGVGGIYQITPQVSALLRGEITIPRFDTASIIIPATAAVQFSPNNMVDLGLEFTFKNFRTYDDGQEVKTSPFDQRSLLLYGQMRF